MNIKEVFKEINNMTYQLVGSGLADEFKSPVSLNNKVYWKDCNDISISMKNIPYKDIYKKISESKNFNFKFPDGGMLQLLYEFDNEGLFKHRLAYFPSPDFEEFQNNPDVYCGDEIYGDIVNKQVMPVIVRIDYNREEVDSETHHPFCHLTLGQYKNCRIPVESPLSPNDFIKFILENFYYIPCNNFFKMDIKDYVTSSNLHIHEKDLLKARVKIR